MIDSDLNSGWTTQQDETIQKLVAWGEMREDIRAMLCTSTRTNPSVPVDLFSDYDIVVIVKDIHPYYENEDWLSDFGEVLVVYRDPLYVSWTGG